jgi:hypothetical protein
MCSRSKESVTAPVGVYHGSHASRELGVSGLVVGVGVCSIASFENVSRRSASVAVRGGGAAASSLLAAAAAAAALSASLRRAAARRVRSSARREAMWRLWWRSARSDALCTVSLGVCRGSSNSCGTSNTHTTKHTITHHKHTNKHLRTHKGRGGGEKIVWAARYRRERIETTQ